MSTTQTLVIELVGRELAALQASMDTCGCQINPYFIIYLVSASGKRELYRSEILKETLNPDWQPGVLYVSVLFTVRERKLK
jgi:hypothetical protein